MSDEQQEQQSDGGVVRVRQVVSRPITWQERAAIRGEGPDVSELHPEAPKPKPRNEYRAVLKQMKRTHKSAQQKQPSYMSDVKL